MPKTDFFYLGPPKTASTWLYHCLREHPEINASNTDEPNYFDINYFKGQGWYDGLYDPDSNGTRIDCTPNYLYNIQALGRILAHNPNAKFAFGLRNPVDRSFSHYWHVKKNGKISYDFDEGLSVYTAFQIWLEPSLKIADGIEFLLNHISKDNLYFYMFDALKGNETQIIKDIYTFIGLESDFKPQSLNAKINIAGPKRDLSSRLMHKASQISGISDSRFSGKTEYLNGVAPETRTELISFFEDSTKKIETLLDINLTAWRKI